MKKQTKLSLNALKVESFTTSIREANVETIRGGAPMVNGEAAVANGFPGFTQCCSYLQGCMPSFSPGCNSITI